MTSLLPSQTLRQQHWLRVLVGISQRIDRHINSSGAHSIEVALLVRSAAIFLGYSSGDVRSLYWAARLHDIGKVAVPVEMLIKRGPLNDCEWQMMRLHPMVGANIIEGFRPVAHLAPWIYHHQEKFDGSGYPDGLRGNQIPAEARLLTIADAYEAMTGGRCYRPPVPHRNAALELKAQRGRHFDPHMVTAFLEAVEYSRPHREFHTGDYGPMD